MMPPSTAKYLLADARKALAEDRLTLALDSIRGLASAISAADEAEEAEALSQAYSMLLDYMERGADDPGRSEMYAGFLRQADGLCDRLARLALISGKDTAYARVYSAAFDRGRRTLADTLRPGTDYRTVFDALWTAPPLSDTARKAAESYFSDPSAGLFERCTAAGALALSATQMFDPARLSLLATLCQSEENMLRAKAAAGLAFALVCHRERLAKRAYPALDGQLRLLADDPARAAELEEAQTMLLLSLDTKELTRRMHEKIVPGIMDCVHDKKLTAALGTENRGAGLARLLENPEWSSPDSEVRDKVRKFASLAKELSELRKRGADICLDMFRTFERQSPFFTTAANWFCPFTLTHPDLPSESTRDPSLMFVTQNDDACDADKYSLTLAYISATPGKVNIEKLLEDLPEGFTLPDPKDSENYATCSFLVALRSCMRSMYRFFYFYRNREGMDNPFAHDPFFLENSPLRAALDAPRRERLAEFCFTAGRYEDALRLYGTEDIGAATDGTHDDSATLWQKRGFCHQKLGNPKKAAACYRTALSLLPSSAWTLRSLAACASALGRHDEALDCIRRLQALPAGEDDTDLALREAECLIRLGRHADALPPLFKADYLRAGHPRTLRALAWCHLVLGRHDKAEGYYMRILGGEPSADDFLNAGHAAWLTGRTAEAVRRYRRHIALRGDGGRDFLSDDRTLLLSAGLSSTDIALMEEAVAHAATQGKGAEAGA